MEFTCECCQYTTTVKSNYTKHLSSNKHILRKYKQKVTPETTITITETPQVIPKVGIFCKYCNKEYKHKSSLSKHNRYSCTKNEQVSNETQLMIRKMESDIIEFQLERKEFIHERKELQKIFEIQMKQIEYLTCALQLRAHL
jgi:hypothetical protein